MFAVGSLLAALSVNMRMLIAARALQGTAGGGLVQLVSITISDLFSMRPRTLFFGLVEVIWALAGGIGPIVGGAFTELVNWRWCFWVRELVLRRCSCDSCATKADSHTRSIFRSPARHSFS